MAVRKSRKSSRPRRANPLPERKLLGKARAATAERRHQKPETLRLRSFEPSYTVDESGAEHPVYSATFSVSFVNERWTNDGRCSRG